MGKKSGYRQRTGKEKLQNSCYVGKFLVTCVRMDPSEVNLFFYLTVFKIEKKARLVFYSQKP